MRVLREKPCQRRHHRVTAPLNIQFDDGIGYKTFDWSLGGFRIDGFESAIPEIGEELSVSLELPFQGFEIGFAVVAKLVRHNPENQSVSFEFADLPERVRDLLSHFIEDLIRGKMGTVEDAICRIDVPITPISTKPDPNPKEAMQVRRWPIKTVIMSGLYLTLGVLTFSYLGLLLYSNVFRMEVESAVVSAPVQTIRMPTDGIVRAIRFEEGIRVSRGEEIARIENPALLTRISDATIRFTEAKDALWRAEQRARIETERMNLYQIVSRTDRDIALARREAAWESLNAADAHLKRVQTLANKQLATKAKLETAQNRQAKADSELWQAQLELERSTAMESVSERRHYNHKEFVTDLDMIEIDLSKARSTVEMAAMKLHALETMAQNQVIRAPFDGWIVATFQSGDTNLRRDEPLLVLEEERNLTVTAFLNQDEILKVGLNDQAKVFLPALNKHVSARVVSIDRNSAHLNPNADHYTWRSSEDRTATVSLEIFLEQDRSRQVRAGLPAVVIFNRRSTNDIFARLPGVASNTVAADEQPI